MKLAENLKKKLQKLIKTNLPLNRVYEIYSSRTDSVVC